MGRMNPEPSRRKPAVAGQFYYSSPEKLRSQIDGCVQRGITKEDVIGILSPHAGLMYSGTVAGAVYSRINFPDIFVIIGPNHTGLGVPLSIYTEGEWDMPFGAVSIHKGLSKEILQNSKMLRDDSNAHLMEHSIEVQIPFMQYFSKEFKIVPIAMMDTRLEACREIGHAIASAIKKTHNSVVIVASSDMTHYESDESAQRKDRMAIEKIISLDPEGLHTIVNKENISMCGFAPAVVMLFAAIELGAHESELVKYMTSGEVSGDYAHVVGYAGVIIK
ncbi:MAG: AmmeMemoRadiSam system protein B [Nitrospirota bacterium]